MHAGKAPRKMPKKKRKKSAAKLRQNRRGKQTTLMSNRYKSEAIYTDKKILRYQAIDTKLKIKIQKKCYDLSICLSMYSYLSLTFRLPFFRSQPIRLALARTTATQRPPNQAGTPSAPRTPPLYTLCCC